MNLNLIKKFELLFDEKITPHTMALTKFADSDALLSDINDEHNNPFLITDDRVRYTQRWASLT